MVRRAIRWGAARVRRRAAIIAGAAVSLALLAWLVSGDLAQLLREGAALDRSWVLAALICASGSYFAIALALEEMLGLLGYALSFAEVLGIGLVSTTANYFVSSLGVSGFALKAHLLRKRGVPFGGTVTASVVTSAILYLVLAALMTQGLLAFALERRGVRLAVMEGAAGLIVLVAGAIAAVALFFNRKVPGRLALRIYRLANRGAYLFSRAEIPREDFAQFEDQLSDGLARVRAARGELGRTVLYTCADWALTMLTLWCAMKAAGVRLSVGQLSAGFAAGQAATLIPVLPAGLGAVEGSMAAVFGRFGIPWEKALAAVLVFRAAYYILPGLISAVVLWGLQVSEPKLLEDTLRETLPEELKLRARDLEHRRHP